MGCYSDGWFHNLEHRNVCAEPERQRDSLGHIVQLPLRRRSATGSYDRHGRLLQNGFTYGGGDPSAWRNRWHANAHADSYCHSNSNSHSYGHSYVYTDRHSYCYVYTDRHSYCDSNTDRHSYCDSNRNGYRHRNSYCYAHPNTDSHGYRDSHCNSYCYGNRDSDSYADLNSNSDCDTYPTANAYTEVQRAAEAASYSPAAPLAGGDEAVKRVVLRKGAWPRKSTSCHHIPVAFYAAWLPRSFTLNALAK